MIQEDDILRTFVDEATQRLRQLTELALAWERDPSSDSISGIMRELHSLKGTARMVECEDIGNLAHALESRCEPFRTGGAPPRELIEQLFDGIDRMTVGLQEVAQALEGPPASKSVDSVAGGSVGGSAGSSVGGSVGAIGSAAGAAGGNARTGAPKRDAQGGFIRLSAGRVGELAGLASEVTAASSRAEHWIGTIRSVRSRLSTIRRQLGLMGTRRCIGVTSTLAGLLASYSIDLDRLDRELGSMAETVRAGVWKLGALADELHDVVIDMRLVSLNTISTEIARAVHELTQSQGKRADFHAEGMTIGVDRELLDPLKDMLVHLIRNAVDHGLEPPEERRAAGKPDSGTITLSAKKSGRHVVVTLRDDGRGIDADRVAQRAVEMGMIDARTAQGMSRAQRMEFIFRPGFSTRTTVTDVSGRGVGLDAVQVAAARYGGTIQVDSEPGRGTTFSMRLPSTLSMLNYLLGIWDRRYVAVPLAHVHSCRRLSADEAREARRLGYWRSDEGPVTLFDARGGMPAGTPGGAPEAASGSAQEIAQRAMHDERQVLVMLRMFGTTMALLWDELIGVEELAVRSLNHYVDLPGVESVAVLPTGDVVQVLDVVQLAHIES